MGLIKRLLKLAVPLAFLAGAFKAGARAQKLADQKEQRRKKGRKGR